MSFLVLEIQDQPEVDRVCEVLASAGINVRVRNMRHVFPGQAKIGGMTAAYGESSNSGTCEIFVVTRVCGVEAPHSARHPSDWLAP